MALCRIVTLVTLVLFAASCGNPPPPAIDPQLAARIPRAATIVAGVNLDRVRSSPLQGELPQETSAFLDSFSTARAALVASDGVRYLVLTRGDFPPAPPGTTLLAKGVAAAGSPDWVRDAGSLQNSKNGLVARAEGIAATSDLWVAAAGSAKLPVSGNGENLNGLLHATEYATLSVRLADRIALEAVGTCSGEEAARHLEETVRAFVHIGAGRRDAELSALLRRVRVSRDGRTVHVDLTMAPGELRVLLGL